jgi:hypothetical protein
MMLKCISQTEYKSVEIQRRTRIPACGDLVEVTVDSKPVLARVTRVTDVTSPSGSVDGTYRVHADEIGT